MLRTLLAGLFSCLSGPGLPLATAGHGRHDMGPVAGPVPDVGSPTAPQVPAPRGPGTCTNTGTKRSAPPSTLSDGKTLDCNNDGVKECGFREYFYPAEFQCDASGTLPGTCCQTSVIHIQMRTWNCAGKTCVPTAWINLQDVTTATPVRCEDTRQHPDCVK